MSNSYYLEKFNGLEELFEYFGEEPGTSQSHISAPIEDTEDSNEEEIKIARNQSQESYLAILLIIRSDPNRYGEIIADIKNGFTRNID